MNMGNPIHSHEIYFARSCFRDLAGHHQIGWAAQGPAQVGVRGKRPSNESANRFLQNEPIFLLTFHGSLAAALHIAQACVTMYTINYLVRQSTTW
jgi:hypothetical protein